MHYISWPVALKFDLTWWAAGSSQQVTSPKFGLPREAANISASFRDLWFFFFLSVLSAFFNRFLKENRDGFHVTWISERGCLPGWVIFSMAVQIKLSTPKKSCLWHQESTSFSVLVLPIFILNEISRWSVTLCLYQLYWSAYEHHSLWLNHQWEVRIVAGY